MLALTVAVFAAIPRHYGQPWRGARMTAQFPKLVAPEVEPMCDASRSQLCTYSVLDGMCLPQNICRPASCGMLMCTCKPLSVNALPPWHVLELNFSDALDPIAVRQAFHARARVLAPERNPACLARASREYIAARRARDTLLLLASISSDAQPNDRSKQHATEPPLPVSFPRAGRWRQLRRKRQTKSSNLGTQITMFLAIKLALYRLMRNYKTKLVHGWWGRVRKIASEAHHFASRAVSSVLRFCRANSALLIVTLLSFTAIPAVLLG